MAEERLFHIARAGMRGRGGCSVKMIAEYLEHALQFERMAAEATDPQLKESLAKQGAAYRKLASERAERQGLSPVNLPVRAQDT